MVAPHRFDSVSAAVATTAGLSRGTGIRIWQDGVVVATRVISFVDAPAGRVYWVHPNPEWRLPYDAPLAGVNPDVPLLIESVDIPSPSSSPVSFYSFVSGSPQFARTTSTVRGSSVR